MTLIQRFGSALNLHFHVLFIDGVFSLKNNADLRFHRVNAPTSKELNALVATISERVARYLERQGHPVCSDCGGPIKIMASIEYLIAMGASD